MPHGTIIAHSNRFSPERTYGDLPRQSLRRLGFYFERGKYNNPCLILQSSNYGYFLLLTTAVAAVAIAIDVYPRAMVVLHAISYNLTWERPQITDCRTSSRDKNSKAQTLHLPTD